MQLLLASLTLLLAVCCCAGLDPLISAWFQGGAQLTDTNRDGFVSEQEVKNIVFNNDLDGNGEIPLSEHLEAWQRIGVPPGLVRHDLALAMFNFLDQSNADFVIRDEDIHTAWKNADANGDGSLTVQEMVDAQMRAVEFNRQG